MLCQVCGRNRKDVCAVEECGKETILQEEGDAWFERNKDVIAMTSVNESYVSTGCKLFEDILQKTQLFLKGARVLEIGSSYGYNLMFLNKKFPWEYVGIEPSRKAVDYGNYLSKQNGCNVSLFRGTADELPFEDTSFDIVMLGFCMYNFDRKYIYKVIGELDRVLKVNGLVAVWDFDTKIPFRRENIHSKYLPTYKFDVSHLFCGNPQYTLIEKRSFSHAGESFCDDMQERCALHVFYKEKIEEGYILL